MEIFLNLLKKYKINDFDFILDVGAGWGLESENFGKKFPEKTIYSFEGNPDSIAECEKNIKSENVKLIKKLVWDENTFIDFFPCTNGNPGASSVFLINEEYNEFELILQSHKLKIETIKLDSFIDNNQLNDSKGIIWMDLQGSELKALKGLEKNLKDIVAIWTEAQYRPIYDGVNTFDEIDDFLQLKGYILVYPEIENIKKEKKEGKWFNDFCYIKKNYV